MMDISRNTKGGSCLDVYRTDLWRKYRWRKRQSGVIPAASTHRCVCRGPIPMVRSKRAHRAIGQRRTGVAAADYFPLRL
jgi:hypothetical protein